MTALEAYARWTRLKVPAARTAELAAAAEVSASSATQFLNALAAKELVGKVKRGLWWISRPPDPLVLPEYLTAPYPAYVSMQSALYYRGVLSQLAEVVYVASLGWPEVIRTPLGVFSVHRIAPELFDGFDLLESGAKLATVEKALFDMAYLSGSRTRLFVALPELELTKRLNVEQLQRWLERLPARGGVRGRVANWFRARPELARIKLRP